jgi:hypothetical protein
MHLISDVLIIFDYVGMDVFNTEGVSPHSVRQETVVIILTKYTLYRQNGARGSVVVRHYATSQKVACSRTDEVSEFFKFT